MSKMIDALRGEVAERSLRLVHALAEHEGIKPEALVGRMIDEWADKQFRLAEIQQQVLAEHRAGLSQPRKPRGEKAIEGAILDELRAAGFTVKSQVKTSAGIADLVVYSDSSPRCVIEVKSSMRTPGAVNRACGQARAYADAISAAVAIATAPGVEHVARMGVEVLTPDAIPGFLRSIKSVTCVHVSEAHS